MPLSSLFCLVTRHLSLVTGYVLTPSFCKNHIIGHQFVNPDCNKFAPTNAVNQYHFGFTQVPSASDTRTNDPAISRNERSNVIVTSQSEPRLSGIRHSEFGIFGWARIFIC